MKNKGECILKKLRIGLLGSGFVQNFHMESYREISQAEVVAVASRNPKHVKKFAKKWGIKTTYSDEDFIEKLCSDPNVDVVDIGIPNFLHMKAAITAAENHKNVICEKPLGRNTKEAQKMVKAVEKYGVLHAYAENELFSPHNVKAKEFIDSGAIGKVIWVRSREAHFGPHSQWFWNKKLAGGGCIVDMGCHSIEAARFFIGKERKPLEVFAWTATLVHRDRTDAEDNSLTLVKYEGDALAQSENSWAAHGGLDHRFEIHGTDGAIFLNPTRETGMKVFTVAPEKKVGYVIEKAEVMKGWLLPLWGEYLIYGYYPELKHFIESFLKDELPRETFHDGLIVNRIMDAAYKSAKSGKWVKL